MALARVQAAMRVTLLGTGTSHGVPMIGCSCAVCRSNDPRDKRTRPSILVESRGTTLLVDTSPEMRLRLVAAATSHVDAVLFTHSHADHLHGIDDLRRFNEMLPGGVPVYAAPDVLQDITVRFPYIFASGGQVGGGIPTLSLRPINGPFEACGVAVVPVPVLHGQLPILGFRFGAFAYVTDCSHIPPSSMDLLRGLDVLVLDALRPEPHPTHFSLAQAIAMAQALRPKRTFFTHLTHAIAHRDVSATLPDGIHLGYDGLRIYVEGGSNAGQH